MIELLLLSAAVAFVSTLACLIIDDFRRWQERWYLTLLKNYRTKESQAKKALNGAAFYMYCFSASGSITNDYEIIPVSVNVYLGSGSKFFARQVLKAGGKIGKIRTKIEHINRKRRIS